MLELADVHAGYGPSHVLQGMSLVVGRGEAVALFGRNGVGKTTTLRAIMGWITPSRGTIRFQGQDITKLRTDRICRMGIGLVPEDRRVFPSLSVEENLRLGLFQGPQATRAVRDQRLARAYEWFPRLAERRRQAGITLSGGEQQMLVIARALMGAPKLLLIDEPSEGLAPKVVAEVFSAIRRMCSEGISIILVEQNVRGALDVVDRCYVVERGRAVAEVVPQDILARADLRARLSI
jgi:branched-chain amino acid transport system ATP-binding protein